MVDLFGEAVQSTITTGDHYRKRHDAFKMRLFQMCQWAGLEAEVEVFNLLAGDTIEIKQCVASRFNL